MTIRVQFSMYCEECAKEEVFLSSIELVDVSIGDSYGPGTPDYKIQPGHLPSGWYEHWGSHSCEACFLRLKEEEEREEKKEEEEWYL